MGSEELSRKVDVVCVAVLLTSMVSTLINCEEAYDFRELPERVRYMMDNATKLLNATERLVLYWGVNGAMNNNRICWTSQKIKNSWSGVDHDIRFRTNESTKSTSNFTEERATGNYIVSPSNRIPTVLLSVHGSSAASKLSGDYILLEGNPACFVMGEIIPNKTTGSKCLYWTREWSKRDDREKCELAFKNNCSTVQDTFYSMENFWRFCNFCTSTNDTIIPTTPS
uniref:Lipocalin n=1 Tax=Rhipicephalus appendiculatus TaxID=34631 RepID=A0A131YFP6_RHIAP